VFNKKFEFWVDYLSFDVAGPFTDTGFKQIVTQAQFNGAYAGRNMSFFGDPYTQLAAALEDPRFSRIGREGSTDDRKREIAALMAHIWQETGGLQFVTEVSPPSDYVGRRTLSTRASPGKPILAAVRSNFLGTTTTGRRASTSESRRS
jgi:hypothetical protein